MKALMEYLFGGCFTILQLFCDVKTESLFSQMLRKKLLMTWSVELHCIEAARSLFLHG